MSSQTPGATTLVTMANDSGLPRDENDWEQYKDAITDLYIKRNETCATVIEIMAKQYGFDASEKQYKTHFRNWGLAKNFKQHEAQQIASGKLPSSPRVRNVRPEELKRKAERSYKRSQARRKATSVSQSNPQSPQSPDSAEPESRSHQTVLIVAPHRPKPGISGSPSVITPTTKSFELLFQKLRLYTHKACVEGCYWEPESTQNNIVGRKALRELSCDLTAGSKYFEEGKEERATRLWRRALEKASQKDLLDTWYYETPIALLFELGRLVHNGHEDIAALLIQRITVHARACLDENDKRHSLFAAFESLEISQLKDGYSSAALSLLEGLRTRLEKHNRLLYQFGLNRALDLVWFDPKTDLEKWVVPVEKIDQAIGPDDPLSVYFLLLDAYRQVAAGCYTKADKICQQVSRRLNVLKQSGKIEPLKVGMAYRRLGRQYYEQQQYDDARRTLNQALRYIGQDRHSVLVEIYHLQERMARLEDDTIDVEFWQTKLQEMEASFADQEPDEILTPTTQFGSIDDISMSDVWTSMDDYSSLGANNFAQSIYPAFHGYAPAGYAQFPVPINTQNVPTMYFNHDHSGVRLTEDPESLRESTYENQTGAAPQSGTINPAMMSMNTNFYAAQPGMVFGSVTEL